MRHDIHKERTWIAPYAAEPAKPSGICQLCKLPLSLHLAVMTRWIEWYRNRYLDFLSYNIRVSSMEPDRAPVGHGLLSPTLDPYCCPFFCAAGPISRSKAAYDTCRLPTPETPTYRIKNSGSAISNPMKIPVYLLALTLSHYLPSHE